MNPSATAPGSRLAGLEQYLREDPANAALLADACEAAIEAGARERALAHLDTAQRLGLDTPEWTFRRARLCIAQRELPQARALLQGLRTSVGEHPVLAHDLAYVHWLEDDLAGCRALLEPWLEVEVPGAQHEAVQVLWLRATHQMGAAGEAWAWAQRRHAAGPLAPLAQGVASLAAVDCEAFAAARDWADAALARHPGQLEALVARATVAMAELDPAGARELLQRALEHSPRDGRVWSALGFASLQAGALPQAQAELERAVVAMPGHVGTWHALGWSRLLQGKRAAALDAFRQALELDRNFAESHGALGLLLAMEGDSAQARHHLDIADKLDGSNVTGRYARAFLGGEAQDLERLQQLAARLLDRPGFFGSKLSESVRQALRQRPDATRERPRP